MFRNGARVKGSAGPAELDLPENVTQAGVLFKNTGKLHDKDHDFNGAIRIDGVTYQLRGRWTVGRTGVPFIKLQAVASE